MAGFLDMADEALGLLERACGDASPSPSPHGTSVPPGAGPDQTRGGQASAAGPQTRSTRRTEFSVVDAIDAETGRPVYLVRNGRGDSAACSSPEFAQRVRVALG